MTERPNSFRAPNGSLPPARLDPLIVHPLPAAPSFTSREMELEALREFWQDQVGVLSLVGLGGAGKTALAERFLKQLLASDPPDGLLVWSFYEEPDANAFLQTAYQYFTGGRTAEAKGAGWFYLLKEALATGGRYLLILDGLERVQRPESSAMGIYGAMEDPLLRGFLTRLAAGAGSTRAIITSRFPVSDIERWTGHGYTLVTVDHFGSDAARALLRTNGVQSDDSTLDRLIGDYGGHALTLDLLSGAVVEFFGGDPAQAPRFHAPQEATSNLAELRLGRVLRLYEEHLPPAELALVSRLCIFRFGVDIEALSSIFLGSPREMVAGALAGTTRAQLQGYLDALVRRHLTACDTSGKYTVHPAVRDYFYHLFREPALLHEAVREHLSSLTQRPGVGLPTDKTTLDLLEELIYHALHAGNQREAVEIYRHRLGGNDHLNAKLGEYARTHRILRAFEECPDKSGMYHSLRAFGRFEEALEWRPQNRYIRLLTGNLTALAQDPSETTRRFARFLQGEQVPIPERSPDVPLPAAWLHLYRGDTAEARRTVQIERDASLYQDDVARCDLALAAVERREGRLEACRERLDAAAVWVLHSGSQEHLGIVHLIRARLAVDERRYPAARAALEEGLHTAIESGFDLLRIDLLAEQARLHLLEGEALLAEATAREAQSLARAPQCRFAWGDAETSQLLAEALRAQGRLPEAREALAETLAIRKRIADPAAVTTARALRDIEIAQQAS